VVGMQATLVWALSSAQADVDHPSQVRPAPLTTLTRCGNGNLVRPPTRARPRAPPTQDDNAWATRSSAGIIPPGGGPPG
jgi:hypothetical protein